MLAGSRGDFYLNLNLLFARACHHLALVDAQRCRFKPLPRYRVPNINVDIDLLSIISTVIAYLPDRRSFK